VELKAFFKTLYQGIVAYDCLHISFGQVFLLYTSCVLGEHPFALNKI
jgi:hypothetical protein